MDSLRPLYLDHNATAPLLPEVAEALRRELGEGGANPSSLHASGTRARRRLDDARAAVAELLEAPAEELVFTSGGTEANHLALAGSLLPRPQGAHLVVSAIEHSSTLAAARRLESLGARVTWVEPRRDGVVPVERFLAALEPQTRLVACMAANNESGVVQPFAELGAALAPRAIALHVDAVQWVGRQPLAAATSGATTLSCSAHKLGGPPGVGALWVRRGTRLEPWIGGGRQERGRRGGTEALLLIVGFAAAARAALRRAGDGGRAARDAFEQALRRAGAPLTWIGSETPRLPNTSLFCADGRDGATLVRELSQRGVEVASGSACQAGASEPSHVLRAMGFPAAQARAALRFSFGASDCAEVGALAAERLLACLAEPGRR
ncbi:MAG: cysteine desulfurase [Planctomycetes bacterium]|nr:cysteine desulfurase [Planctomycetota bacterium]